MENEHESETALHKCDNCGAVMAYDVASGNLKCGHCGTVRDFTPDDEAESRVQRRALTDAALREHADWKEGTVFRCDNCGAKEVLDKRDLAKNCPFCGSSHIVELEDLPGIKPDSVIPFQITRETALSRFKKWIKSKFLAPKDLKKEQRTENFNGMYSSSWSFSANTNSLYSGTLGRTETRTRYNGKTHTTYTTTHYFKVSGQIEQDYRDFFVQSGDRIPSAMFDKLKPFNLSFLKIYRAEYLSGIIAEHYSRTIEVCFNDFADFVRRDLRHKIMRKHGADTVATLNIDTNYRDKQFNYVLLPVFIANYTYKNKLYNFYVNGASGKVVGKYPISGWKLFFTILGVGLVIGGLVAAGMFLI
jgi:DNA-directed RNA polymerase subunit RPC12/RpoP